MPKWFRRKPKIEYWPEHARVKGTKPSEYKDLMLQMIGGYENHEAIFRLLMIELRSKEGEISLPCTAKTEAESFQWIENQKRLSAEIGILRWAVRLPILGERMKETEGSEKDTNDHYKEYD